MYTRTVTDPKSSNDIARIHMESFPGFFLTFLGEGFLTELYWGFITDTNSGVICAFDDTDRMVGFLAYSKDISLFYQYLIGNRFVPLAWRSMAAFLKKPAIIFRLLRAFRYSRATQRPDRYVHLSSLGVMNSVQNQGIGGLLVSTLKKTVDDGSFVYINVDTDKCDNIAANDFYLSHGFKLDHSFTTPEGREMNEYRFWLG